MRKLRHMDSLSTDTLLQLLEDLSESGFELYYERPAFEPKEYYRHCQSLFRAENRVMRELVLRGVEF